MPEVASFYVICGFLLICLVSIKFIFGSSLIFGRRVRRMRIGFPHLSYFLKRDMVKVESPKLKLNICYGLNVSLSRQNHQP